MLRTCQTKDSVLRCFDELTTQALNLSNPDTVTDLRVASKSTVYFDGLCVTLDNAFQYDSGLFKYHTAKLVFNHVYAPIVYGLMVNRFKKENAFLAEYIKVLGVIEKSSGLTQMAKIIDENDKSRKKGYYKPYGIFGA